MRAILRNQLLLGLIASLAACAPGPTPALTPSSLPPTPTDAPPATPGGGASFFQAGVRYGDASGDMDVSFLDVMAFRATVNEDNETLAVLLTMRDVPDTADLGQVTNLIEYTWMIDVYLDPSEASLADPAEDFYFTLNTDVHDFSVRSLTPVPGEPEQVPIHRLFENRSIYDSRGQPIGELQVEINPDRNTLLFIGNVPGITSSAVFSFSTFYYDGTFDRPDHLPLPQLGGAATATAVPAAVSDSSMFRAGQSYSDSAGDIEVGFLDVTGFQATVNEEQGLLEVVLRLRDIPETATRRQIRNVAEYMWEISIFTDPAKIDTADARPDYYLFLMTVITDLPSGEEVMEPAPGQPETVPVAQLWDVKIVNNEQGDYLYDTDAIADPEQDTITLRARIPGLHPETAFRFATVYYDGTTDRPDHFVPPDISGALATPLPETTGTPQAAAAGSSDTELIPAGTVRAYPGPDHYAGDVLTFEMMNNGGFEDETLEISMTLDNSQTTKFSAIASWNGIFLPQAFDTAGLTGRHTLTFTTPDGQLNETYAFEVLPADQRPSNEATASWQTREMDCCILHYISNTAAARDIEFIAAHFQQAAVDFAAITGSDIDPRLDVYIMDRIWGNGGFGGNGELVISYTDRYYGPTIGGEGLETLARHEFTHAAGVDWNGGAGVEFNYEGLAVYIAGGHYKPEPLDKRGAALFDLGHYVPVGQFFTQHELNYLYPAAMLTYIVETYGEEKMWAFLESDETPQDDQPGPLEPALQNTFGVSLEEFDRDFQDWLESNDPGEQLDDLRLTIDLQNLRREYQNTYAPPPNFLLASAEEGVARPEYLLAVMREARAPANIAVELIIAHGQQAILEGAYARAEELNAVLEEILETGEFEDPLGKEYLDIVLAAASSGYEIVNLDLQGSTARARATVNPPALVDLKLQKVNGGWQVQP